MLKGWWSKFWKVYGWEINDLTLRPENMGADECQVAVVLPFALVLRFVLEFVSNEFASLWATWSTAIEAQFETANVPTKQPAFILSFNWARVHPARQAQPISSSKLKHQHKRILASAITEAKRSCCKLISCSAPIKSNRNQNKYQYEHRTEKWLKPFGCRCRIAFEASFSGPINGLSPSFRPMLRAVNWIMNRIKNMGERTSSILQN